MDAGTIENPIADWQHYIRKTFFEGWENRTAVDLTDYAYLFEHHFRVEKIAGYLSAQQALADDPKKFERSHKIHIRTLAVIFTESLLDISDDGKHITSKNIEKAKIIMQDESRCKLDS